MKNDRTEKMNCTWPVGGGLLLGLGAGFFMLPNALVFIACIFAGLGIGLIIAPLFSIPQKN